MTHEERNRELEKLGVILDRCTVKDLYLFETEGIIPDTSDNAYTEKQKQRIKARDYVSINDVLTMPTLTNKRFWVGVKSGVYPSPPVPRKLTNCFTSVPIYRLNGKLVFRYFGEGYEQQWYLIPEKEKIFIQ